jgi:protein-disulfide isomerase
MRPHVLCLLLLVQIAIVVEAQAQNPGTTSVPPDMLLEARSKGSPAAPVTVYEMSDFQCPYCRRHAVETFPELERRFIATGKVRWVFINFPLTQIHPNAAAAAEFAMCSAKAGRFWPIHDLIFKYQDKWAPLKDPAPFLLSLADSAGMGRDAVMPCLMSGEMRSLVQSDAQGAARSGAASTPTFYIEGGLLEGAAPLTDFVGILDSIFTAKVTAKR